MFACRWLLDAGCRLSYVGYGMSVVGYWVLRVCHRSLVVGCVVECCRFCMLYFAHVRLVVGDWFSRVGGWIVGCWLLSVVCWLLRAGCLWLIIG